MPEALHTRYAPAGDGGHLAYRILGSGAPDLLMMSGELISIDTMHDEPGYAGCIERLANFSRLVCFDQRGVGMSDPVPLGAPPTVEQWALARVSGLSPEHVLQRLGNFFKHSRDQRVCMSVMLALSDLRVYYLYYEFDHLQEVQGQHVLLRR